MGKTINNFNALGYTWRYDTPYYLDDSPNVLGYITPIDFDNKPIETLTIGRCTRESYSGFRFKIITNIYGSSDIGIVYDTLTYDNRFTDNATNILNETLIPLIKTWGLEPFNIDDKVNYILTEPKIYAYQIRALLREFISSGNNDYSSLTDVQREAILNRFKELLSAEVDNLTITDIY